MRRDLRIDIREDDLLGADIATLLREHMEQMRRISPPESVHALDLEALRAPDVTFWCAWQDEKLLGCAALKELDAAWGEIKSMRTAEAHRGRGVASRMLEHILAIAEARGYRRLSLETGSMIEFAPARRLYARYGFEPCGPFAHYEPDPNSTFMTKTLGLEP